MENKWIPITDKPKVKADGCSEQVLLRYNYGLPKYIHVLGYYSLNTDKWYSSDGADYPYTHYQYIVDLWIIGLNLDMVPQNTPRHFRLLKN